MAFKSYCWCIGTTSFRVENLNYKNECQLRYLDELFSKYPSLEWNKELQTKYFDLLVSKDFIKDYNAIKDKDAREKTSGLCDLGLVYRGNRHLTEIGKKINEISLSGDFSSNNILGIPKDSYIYLLQFLKLQIVNNDTKIKPFIALLYMLIKLDYLTKDEFTYLFPICMNNNELIKITAEILMNRGKISIDNILINKMLSMDNYKEALSYFINVNEINEDVMEVVGMHRKSTKYDRPFYFVYLSLLNLFNNKDNYDESIFKQNYNNLKASLEKVNHNQGSKWKKYFSLVKKVDSYEEEFQRLLSLDIFQAHTIDEFKCNFFKKWHLFKWQLTLADYYDLNKRYFSLTDIIKYEGERFTLNEIGYCYFSDIIDKILFEPFVDSIDYEEYFCSFKTLENISKVCTKTKEDITAIINNKYGALIKVNELEAYIKDIRNNEFIALIDKKFNKNVILHLLDCFKSRNDNEITNLVTEDATPSTIFEYILGIIWFNISERTGYLEDYMNLSLDANFLPKSHAPGGDADLIFTYNKTEYYPRHDLLLEATLSESTGQRHMEWEPVSRHLEFHLNKTHNKYDYVVFVASQLEQRTLQTFRTMKYYPMTVYGENIGLKIIPLDIDFIKKVIQKDKNYNELYSVFDKFYASNDVTPAWYENLCKNI